MNTNEKQTSKGDTPETDEFYNERYGGVSLQSAPGYEHARRLERERDDAVLEWEHATALAERLLKERDEARKERDANASGPEKRNGGIRLEQTPEEEAAFYESGLSAHGCLENLDGYARESIARYGRLLLAEAKAESELRLVVARELHHDLGYLRINLCNTYTKLVSAREQYNKLLNLAERAVRTLERKYDLPPNCGLGLRTELDALKSQRKETNENDQHADAIQLRTLEAHER